MRHTYVMPIAGREAARGGSIRLAVERVEQGFLVGIFPEGTPLIRRRAGVRCLSPWISGNGSSNESFSPSIPLPFPGHDRAMPRGAWFIRPQRIHVVYGNRFTPDELTCLASGEDDAFRELAHQRVSECAATARTKLSSFEIKDRSQ